MAHGVRMPPSNAHTVGVPFCAIRRADMTARLCVTIPLVCVYIHSEKAHTYTTQTTRVYME